MRKPRRCAQRLFLAFLLFGTCALPALAQDDRTRIEFFGAYSWTKDDSQINAPGLGEFVSPPAVTEEQYLTALLLSQHNLTNTQGWNGAVTFYLTRWLGLVADFGGQYSPRLQGTSFQAPDQAWHGELHGSSHSFLFGPRFVFRPGGRVKPFVQGLVGVSRLDYRASGEGQVTTAIGPGGGLETHSFDLEMLENRVRANSLAGGIGGGVDLRVSRHLAVRLIQVDLLGAQRKIQGRATYLPRGSNQPTVLNYRPTSDAQINVRFSYGLVFSF